MFHPKRLRLIPPILLVGLSLMLHPVSRHKALTLLRDVKQISSAEPAQRANFDEVTDDSTSHRLVLWNNSFQVARRNVWLGVGPGCLKEAVDLHRGDKGFMPNPRGKDGDAHSQYLHHLAERGIPGLAAILFFMAVPIVAAFRSLRRPADEGFPARWACWGLLAFFIAFPVINVTERVFDTVEPAMIFFLLASILPAMKINPPGGFDRPERSGGVGSS
jgi:O-antigen ligase